MGVYFENGVFRGCQNKGSKIGVFLGGVKNRGILGQKGENPENQQNRVFWGILPNS